MSLLVDDQGGYLEDRVLLHERVQRIFHEPECGKRIHGANEGVVAGRFQPRGLGIRVGSLVEALVGKLPQKWIAPQIIGERGGIAGLHDVHQMVPTELLVSGNWDCS